MESQQAILQLDDNLTMNVNVFHSLWDDSYYCITNESNEYLYAADEYVLFTRFSVDRCSLMVKFSKDNDILSFDGRVIKYCTDTGKFSFNSGNPVKLVMN